jgi:RNA methyltransferase, TrmH family
MQYNGENRTIMITLKQEKIVKSLHTKKGRQKHGLCLIEGEKLVAELEPFIDYSFRENDTNRFAKLVTTKTPQFIAAVAPIPKWTKKQITEQKSIVILDGVQDPGNVGTILRLCQAFNASLILIESADPSSPKVVRSSAGALFHTPWIIQTHKEAKELVEDLGRRIYRLELTKKSQTLLKVPADPSIFIAGNEGQGISESLPGSSLAISHSNSLESLNVATSLAITLHHFYNA